jgi:putative chitinase
VTVSSLAFLARPLAALAAVAALLLVGAREASAHSVRVAPGETLSEIAARAGVSTGALAAANGLSDPDRVIAGRALTIPSGSAGASWSGASSGSHRVRPGESLSEIAARSGVSTSALAAANGIRDPDHVVAGRLLTIPTASPSPSPSSGSGSASAGSYRVRPGDTLSEIAARSGVSASALAAANGISDPDLVVVGRSLAIPGGSTACRSGSPPARPTRPQRRRGRCRSVAWAP